MLTAPRLEILLFSGEWVLGKETVYGDMPLTYANRTQAERRAKADGCEVIQRGHLFFVRVPKIVSANRIPQEEAE